MYLLPGFSLGISTTDNLAIHDVIKYSGFIPAYFLQLSAYLIFALFIGLLIKKTGLAMGLMFLYSLLIEPVLGLRIQNEMIKGFLPMRSISNLIHMPFGKYLLREIQDYVRLTEVLIVIAYAGIFLMLIYVLLRKRDLK